MTTVTFKESKIPSRQPRNLVDAYLKEIGRVPLLEADEEIILAKQVERMMSCLDSKEQLEKETSVILDNQDWAEAIGLSEKELKQILRQGQRAKNEMIQSNLRLVVSVAKKYQKRDLELLDLIQEGTFGLERAVEKFDYRKGYKFSTYAFWWIRQGITRAIAQQSRTIRLPIHITEKLNKIKKTQRELSQKLKRSVTTNEVAQALDMSSEEIRKYLQMAKKTMSLDLRVGQDKNTELSELIQDESTSVETQLNQSLLKQEIWNALSELNPKQREVLWLSFGLEDGQEWTLTAIGKKLELSRERVRQLRNKALKILKSQNIGNLHDYLVV
ncbi:MAG: RNA polymerase sigma factor, RpoD/SigA family [Xenococcaceae cyanobacterium MO_167.B52]|nr:RNA polymerase sigma factor, RpoD/SigA family [Xenococcaceae cyanobacterium MO_167.B52]